MLNDPIVLTVTATGALVGLAWFALWAKTRKPKMDSYQDAIKELEAVTTIYSANPAVEVKPLTSRKRSRKNESE